MSAYRDRMIEIGELAVNHMLGTARTYLRFLLLIGPDDIVNIDLAFKLADLREHRGVR